MTFDLGKIIDKAKEEFGKNLDELQKLPDYIKEKYPNLKNPMEFAQKFYADNSLRQLIGGKIRISEKTLNEMVQKMLADRQEIKSVILSLYGGYMEGAADVLVKSSPAKIAFRVNSIEILLSAQAKEVSFTLEEAPKVELEGAVKNILAKVSTSLIRSLHCEDKLHDHILKDVEGVSISGNVVTVDLLKISALKPVIKAEIRGVNILDFIRVDKVDIAQDELLILGGLKLPDKVK